MYLENSEKGKDSGEGDLSTEAMLAEQCQTQAADLSSTARGNVELGMKVLVEYTEHSVSEEMDPSAVLEHGNMNTDESGSGNGHTETSERYSESSGFFDSNQTLDMCESLGLRQPLDECSQYCECFKTCKCSELCVNHSFGTKCSPSCEQCAQPLQLFQECKPSDQQSEPSDFDPATLDVNCGTLGKCKMSDFIPKCTDHLELMQPYKPSSHQQFGCFDCETDTSTEDSEQCEMPNISDSVDSLHCGSEYDEKNKQTECTNNYEEEEEVDDDYDASCEPKQNEIELSNEESHKSQNTPVYLCNSNNISLASDLCESHIDAEEHSQQAATLDTSADPTELCGNYYSETTQAYKPTQQCGSSKLSKESLLCWSEEDCSFDCSSVETKSFKTCPEVSIPSELCSDSSEESEKRGQEVSSDEQTEWESFENDEETQQSNINRSDNEKKITLAVDIVIEDYFDLFDRVDYYGLIFGQKQCYVSCFDGGDIHDGLYHEEEEQNGSDKNSYASEEVNEEINVQETEELSEDMDEEDGGQSDGSCDSVKEPEFMMKSETSMFVDEENETEIYGFYTESNNEAEDNKMSFGEDNCGFNEVCNEGAETCLSAGNEESMFAPCAKEITVEGDAYEDKIHNHSECLAETSSATDGTETASVDYKQDDNDEPKDKVLLACSEMEPYWALADYKETGEYYEPGVEEYYAYHIKNIQSSIKQTLNKLVITSYNKTIYDGDASMNEKKYALLQTELQATGVCPEEGKSVPFGITKVTDRDGCDECELNEMSRDVRSSLDIIHSVSEHTKTERKSELVKRIEDSKASEQSRDSEEEQSDDESSETCECEHCISPAEQVLHRMSLSIYQ